MSSHAPYHELRRPISVSDVAQTCGQMLAKGHTRSEDPYEIAGYIGVDAKLDRAIERFAIAYAGQVTADYEAFRKAVRAGKINAASVTA